MAAEGSGRGAFDADLELEGIQHSSECMPKPGELDRLRETLAARDEEIRTLRAQLADRQDAFERLTMRFFEQMRERDRDVQEFSRRACDEAGKSAENARHLLSTLLGKLQSVALAPAGVLDVAAGAGTKDREPGASDDRSALGFGGDDRNADAGRPWLPRELQDFWITQDLRNYILDRFGEEEIGKVEYLIALVTYFEKTKQSVEATALGQELIERIECRVAEMPAVERPDVSIIIPVYNNLAYTLTSILSILQNPSRYTYEILVGDDGSTDATETVVSNLGRSVRNIRHARNKGFLGNCNATAESAKGRVFVFLNNDTVTLPRWLDNLVGALDAPDVGLSGSKLLNGNGSLQEAGGIFWKDGSAWNYGRDQDPRAPEFNYVKDVDYCSGASIALSAELWKELEGFDRIFSPAYCEDADLAFRVRAAGLRCVYHPQSEVIHHEGRSHGTDTTSGIKAYQALNQQKVLARWGHVLEREHFENGKSVFVARDRTRDKPHILVIDHYVPQWDRDAGSRAMFHLMRFFQERGFQVIFWSDNLFYDAPYIQKLQALGMEIIYSAQYEDRLQSWLSEHRAWVDYIVCSRPHITERYLEQIRSATDRPIFYYGHDLHWKRLTRQYEVSRNMKLLSEIATTKKLEESIFNRVDCILYLSKEECDEVKATLQIDKPVVEVPAWCFDDRQLNMATDGRAGYPQRDPYQLLFVGGFSHSPNVDAVIWFAEAIMPKVLRKDRHFRLNIVGSNVPDAIKRLESSSISVLGALSDEKLSELYRTCGMAVVPLRYGAGVKGKVIEAFAKGVPVVTTPSGVQGIPNADALAFVGATDHEFAAAILRIVSEPALADRKVRAASDFVRHRYSDAALARALLPIIPDLDKTTRRVRQTVRADRDLIGGVAL
ncbi:MAG: glycosyltransferase [Hyphomicrobiaceae bacterium]